MWAARPTRGTYSRGKVEVLVPRLAKKQERKRQWADESSGIPILDKINIIYLHSTINMSSNLYLIHFPSMTIYT